jgi:hypothetical protein
MKNAGIEDLLESYPEGLRIITLPDSIMIA